MYEQANMHGFSIISLVPILLFVLIWVVLAIGFARIAGRMGRSPALWAVLSLIPVVNYFFWGYAIFAVVIPFMLDRLNFICARAGAVAATRA